MAAPQSGLTATAGKKPLTLSPLIPSSLSPGEREEGEGSSGEGSRRNDESPGNADSRNCQTTAATLERHFFREGLIANRDCPYSTGWPVST